MALLYTKVPESAKTSRDYWAHRAASALGLPAKQLVFHWWNLSANDGAGVQEVSSAGSGDHSFVNAGGQFVGSEGGVLDIYSGATGSSTIFVGSSNGTFSTAYGAGAGTRSCDLPGGATSYLWLAMQFKVTTTPDAQTKLGLSSYDGSSGDAGDLFWVGVHGATSTTNYVAWADAGAGPTIDSGVAIDGNYHTVETWRKGDAAGYLSLDEATAVKSAAWNPSHAAIVCLAASNGTTAANQNIRMAWVAWATKEVT